ncbi:MAG: hypothetical protein VB877_17870 [Pirellulaceae bacterium]
MTGFREYFVGTARLVHQRMHGIWLMVCMVLLGILQAEGQEAATGLQHPADAFHLQLQSGKKVDVRKLMQADQRDYDKRLVRQEATRQFARINHANGKPYLFVSRRGTKLFGPLAGRYDNGVPMICATYVVGNRHGSLLCWDEGGRPLVYEQYQNGKRQGLRCMFKSCSEVCKEGHLWLAEEWVDGRRIASHLKTAQGQESSEGALNNKNTDYMAAMKALADFEGTLSKNEKQLKISVVQLDQYEKQLAQLARARALAAMIAYQQRALGSGSPLSYGRAPVCRTGGG